MLKGNIYTSIKFIVFKKQMLQAEAVNTDLFNPLANLTI